MNISIHLNDKQKTDIRQEVLNTRQKNHEDKYSRLFSSLVCNSDFLGGLQKCAEKKFELHRSLKINCDHFITLQLSIKVSTSNISTVYFAEVLV